ncbi:MAG TPA: efflux RND transporter periplasmic adaptor subunit [Caldimonas sp.]
MKWALVSAVALAGCFLLWHFVRGTDANDAAAAVAHDTAAVPVVMATAEQRDLPILLKASGRAEAKSSVTVKSRLDGQVAAILFTEGGPVRKGQVLLRMDSAPGKAQFRQVEAVLARDQAQLERLTGESQRNTALFEQGFISKNGLGQSQADLQGAKATLKADQANLDSARLQLGFTDVTSPVDGIAGTALLPVGGAAKANDTALVVINQIRPIYVSFAIPEVDLERVKGALGRGAVPVSASLPGSTTVAEGHLAFLDNAVDPATGTIIAKATFDNGDGRLTPGQYAQVKIPLAYLRQAVVVPVAAVESGVDGPYVFIVRADSTVELRAVTVGAEVDGSVAIASGLHVGDKVVTEGQSHLRAGSRVAVSGAAQASQAR